MIRKLINDAKFNLWKRKRQFSVFEKEIKSCNTKKYSRAKVLEGKMLVLAHSLEKGMAVKNVKLGYGKEKAELLAELIINYQEVTKENGFAIIESLAILDKYMELMTSQGVDIGILNRRIGPIISEHIHEISSYNAGEEHISYSDLIKGSDFDFKQFVQGRQSVRSFSDEIIPLETIYDIIDVANSAPSACNRQPNHVYFTSTQKLAHELERFITGTHSFKNEVPYFMIVTTDRAYFTEDESLQWYVNGGIYLAFLTLACHSRGVGSIIMQWKFGTDDEREFKNLLGIPSSEAVVAILGCGNYAKDGAKCIKAQRKKSGEVIHILK